ncbi:ultraviolet-B receptor UVR8 [Iris pallida]|uniref:Ultraviolet-B receptor UVR8 n=1 Tax=Iris pallida TaxID=29817 RepID=A0AAX6H809_IRIPA|nr:ultraviolet-B receptor UVR8 [Iris pallida]
MHIHNTLALTDSVNLYAFDAGGKGQLGIELSFQQNERGNPERVDIDLS